ncbi:hypoxia up-regulated protein 1-like [Tropilaelaps mercedesae]|uniref:Hypoxia up-regulated protein 1 n=1 Tax=Tropilaelaps mercedesae TaxID=418985 RepID=A0A1V9X1G3_9ACAR|nr:hypoxia up-regulated protein 1-like [Tropilaelaps mercedesae]
MVFSVEELVAMMLQQAQMTAQTTAGQVIKDAVVTVPPFFNQAERKALSRAVKMAGINLLQLINDNTAVALNYGVFRRKEFNGTAVNMLFYDMGTGSTTATVVSFQTGKTKDRGYVETAPILTVRGVGFDRSLGGLDFRLRLGKHLANKFDELRKASKKVSENKRALFKLYKEAERVKKILSANTEINAQVENVMEDVDLKVPVTRQEFEEMCADLLTRVTQPIDDALASSQIPLDEISQVVVIGGNTRIPKIQAILEEYVGGKGLAKSINADEAAAMGGAYLAAYLSKGFKVKTFIAKDANLYPIQIEFSRDGVKNIQRVVFNRNNEFPKKKTILAARMEHDFHVYVNYGDLSFLSKKDQQIMGQKSNISSVLVKGVAEALKKHPSDEAESKGVRIHMGMDASGIFHIEHAETLFEKEAVEEEESTLTRIGSTLGKLFGGGDPEEPKEDLARGDKETKEQPAKEPEASHEEGKKDDKPSEGQEKPAEEKKPDDAKSEENKEPEPKIVKKVAKKVEVKEALESDYVPLDMPDLVGDQLESSIKKLEELDNKDKARLALDKARNGLEAFIHETKDKFATEEYKKASKEAERDAILEALRKEQDWLEYESENADTETLKGKLSSLTTLTKDITERVNEHRERPQAIEALQKLQLLASEYLDKLEKLDEDVSVFTKVELESLANVIKDSRSWLVEQSELQEKTPLDEPPALTMKGIFEKIQILDRETKYLMNKARYAPPKKKVKFDEKTKDDPDKKDEDAKGTTEEKTIEDVNVDDVLTQNAEQPLEETLPAGEDSAVEPAEGSGEKEPEVPAVEQLNPSSTKEETHSEL